MITTTRCDASLLKRALFFGVALGVSAGGCERRAGNSAAGDAKGEQLDAVQSARAFYASRPYYERPREHSMTPKGLGDTDSETCGGCHRAIYEEWELSTHHRAYEHDAQFMAELKKSSGQHDPDAGDVSWLCRNCHTPTYPQLERLVVALENDDVARPVYADNPLFSEAIREDAIGCASCHVQDGVVYGPYGDTDAPHATARGEYLLDERVCTSCHQAVASYPIQRLGCFFSTGEEWRQSRFAPQQPCQHCHMPEVNRKLAEAFDGPVRKTRRHWFGGSLIAKRPEFEAELAPLRSIYGSGLSFELLAHAEAREALIRAQPEANLPEGLFERPIACERECVSFDLEARNDRAGHHVPTGDPERHVTILIEAFDQAGELVARSSELLGSRYVWWPEIKLLSDTRVPSGSSRFVTLRAPRAALPLKIVVTAEKYRMYDEAFAHHELQGRAARGRRFHRSSWHVSAEGALTRTALLDGSHPEADLLRGEALDKQGAILHDGRSAE